MTRWAAVLVLSLLGSPVLSQNFQNPQDAGAKVLTRVDADWDDLLECAQDWILDPGDQSIHAKHVGKVGQFAQSPWRQDPALLPQARQGTAAVLPAVPANKDESPTDQPSGMTQQNIFDVCVPSWGGADDYGMKVDVLRNGPNQPAGIYNHWAVRFRFAFAWDSDDLGTDYDSVWCYDRSDPHDWYTDDSVTDWFECTVEWEQL